MSLFSETIALIKENNLRLSRRRGQNFLIDENILDKISLSAEFCPGDEVLEIGTGFGFLTKKISGLVKKITTFEIDRGVARVGAEVLKECPNVKIIQEDFLESDFKKLFPGGKIKVFGNLPYSITGPIIEKLLENKKFIPEAYLMVQKEVGARILAGPGTKAYGAFSIFCQYGADFKKLFLVSANCFFPKPEGDSAFLKMTPLKPARFNLVDEKLFFNIIRATFGKRRKVLFKVLAKFLKIPEANLKKAYQALGFNPLIRGETLKIEELAELANFLANFKNKRGNL